MKICWCLTFELLTRNASDSVRVVAFKRPPAATISSYKTRRICSDGNTCAAETLPRKGSGLRLPDLHRWAEWAGAAVIPLLVSSRWRGMEGGGGRLDG